MQRLLLSILLSLMIYFPLIGQSLYNFIESAYNFQIHSPLGCKNFFYYKVIDSSTNDSAKAYYLVLYVQGYKIEKGYLQPCSTTLSPAALILSLRNGTVKETKLLLPAEGEDYAASIRKIFPPRLHKIMFEHYKVINTDMARRSTLDSAVKYFDLERVKIYYPANVKEYDSLMNKYANGEIDNPLDKIKFSYDIVYFPRIAKAKKQAALMAYKKYPPFGDTANAEISYFRQVDNTVYILLNADVDGWAGVSYFLIRVHPIIEKTLLQFDDVKTVVWGKVPINE